MNLLIIADSSVYAHRPINFACYTTILIMLFHLLHYTNKTHVAQLENCMEQERFKS